MTWNRADHHRSDRDISGEPVGTGALLDETVANYGNS